MNESVAKLAAELLPIVLGSGIAMVIFFIALVISFLFSDSSDTAGCLSFIFLALTAGAATIFLTVTVVFIAAGGWELVRSLGPIQVEVHVK